MTAATVRAAAARTVADYEIVISVVVEVAHTDAINRATAEFIHELGLREPFPQVEYGAGKVRDNNELVDSRRLGRH
jgi:hypothetical protein